MGVKEQCLDEDLLIAEKEQILMYKTVFKYLGI
jgi:hypothetical protein